MSDFALRPPELKRRNRTLVIVMLVVALLTAAAGTLFLRHFGFHAAQSADIKYH